MTITFTDLDGTPVHDVVDTAQTISDEDFDTFSENLLGPSTQWVTAAGARLKVGDDQSFFQHFPGTDMFRWESSEVLGTEPTKVVDFKTEHAAKALGDFLERYLPSSVDRSAWMREVPVMERTNVASDLTRGSAPSFQSTMAHILYPQTLDDGTFVAGARLVATLVPGDNGGDPRVVRCFRYARVPIASSARAAMHAMRPMSYSVRRPAVRIRPSRSVLRDGPALVKNEIRAALRAAIPGEGRRIRVTTVRSAYYSAPPFVPVRQLLPVWVVRGTTIDESSGERSLLHRLVIPSRALAQVNPVELRKYTGLAFSTR